MAASAPFPAARPNPPSCKRESVETNSGAWIDSEIGAEVSDCDRRVLAHAMAGNEAKLIYTKGVIEW